ncbi:MAG TPA: AraC family transcriptional regulator [Allosphingosinicella sp.]|jgi:AraC family transcriptional regulator|nr:AraC family transcriptional regulator [Allosphingosinicella sp.]
MRADLSFEEWYGEGSFAPYVQDRRLVASMPVWMFDIRQPAGDFPDPPLDEMVIIQDRQRARVDCDLGAGRFRAEPGGIVVVPCLSATQVTAMNPHNIRVLGFSPQRLAGWVETNSDAVDLGHLHASSFMNSFFHQLLDRIWDAGSVDENAPMLFADAALLTLWSELLREARRPIRVSSRGGLAPWQTRRCTEFLNEHASQNVGLEELAALVGLSPFHFARAFKQSTGVPPHRYQLQVRIEKAKALLELTEASVTEIAFEVGYESSQALARLFRREVGVSPSDYRRHRGTGRS